ncbi:DUF4440 domain-containing protein [Pseudonocardiaceae bacterium YIM PH 21723]|nr:DUF4440 domain-containing protein [Pseudonocardiaceae bacterium YIM PH 21723]
MDLVHLYRRWLDELWSGDYMVVEDLVSPDFVGHWPTGTVHGRDALVQMIQQSRYPFSAISMSLDAGPIIDADGELLAARWTFTGTYLGGVHGATVEPGEVIRFSGQDMFRAEWGKFVEYWVSSDGVALMRQLGLA